MEKRRLVQKSLFMTTFYADYNPPRIISDTVTQL